MNMIKRLCALLVIAVMLAAFVPADTEAASSAHRFFKDSVFLGDSITVGFASYIAGRRRSDSGYFSDAQFLCRVGYALAHTGEPDGYDMHPEYDGKLVQPQKAIKSMGVSKIFIMLGVNDVAGNVSTVKSNYKALIRRLKDACPKATIYMIAVFPMTARKESSKRSNSKIDNINVKLRQLAYAEEVNFIDITPALKDDSNRLEASYSSDDYVHLSSAGYKVWAEQMLAYANFQNSSSTSIGSKATVINVKTYVNCRAGASSDARLVWNILKDEVVTIVKQDGEWFQVDHNKKRVWVHGNYLSVEKSGLTVTVGNVEKDANVRSGPSTANSTVASVDKGAVLPVSKMYYNPEWYRVTYNDKDVFISRLVTIVN